MEAYYAEMLPVYLTEMEENLQVLEEQVLLLEKEEGNPEVVQKIFRVAHTLKGSSAAMGFGPVKDLTHEMENVLDLLRNGHLSIDGFIINTLMHCLDYLQHLKEIIQGGGDLAAVDISSIKRMLESVTHEDYRTAVPADGKAAPDTWLRGLWEGARMPLPGADDSVRAFGCRITLQPKTLLRTARYYMIRSHLAESRTVASTYPELDSLDPAVDPEHMAYLVYTPEAEEELCSLLKSFPDVEQVELHSLQEGDLHLLQPVAVPQPSTPPQSDASPAEAVPFARLCALDAPGKKTKKGQTMRVELERLEGLMNLVGELVIQHSRSTQLTRTLLHEDRRNPRVRELHEVSEGLSLLIQELQESVMKTRMQPVGQLFQRFPRMIRDLSQSLDKEVELILVGEETEVDRSVIEEIYEPLVHMVRNSLDHGIEQPGERTAAGKPRSGRLRISGSQEEHHVLLTVEDDGRGIRADKIRESVIRKGLLSEADAKALPDSEIIQWIYKPGFSTAAEITDVSGRGVGLDIVRTHIEKLGGIFQLETAEGQGTRFGIKLPITLAIIKGLLFRIGGSPFGLPMSAVLEILKVKEAELHPLSGGGTAYMYRQQALRVVSLYGELHLKPRPVKRELLTLLILHTGTRRLALRVDELIGIQDVVLKSISGSLEQSQVISGATILGDGQVGLILDPQGIADLALEP
ncbi:chemotaxis protein CheW [Gorillibacterium sp. sgz5001074]|uniref:chemotaxis protein CheW n=1 Tax=Gorillibacterium sp. sgz5001074 TaxID=3446695 RepID=UPI003F67463C